MRINLLPVFCFHFLWVQNGVGFRYRDPKGACCACPNGIFIAPVGQCPFLLAMGHPARCRSWMEPSTSHFTSCRSAQRQQMGLSWSWALIPSFLDPDTSWESGDAAVPAATGARGVENKPLLPLIFKVAQNFEGDSLRGDPGYCKLREKRGTKG